MPETSLYTRKYTIRLIATRTCFPPHERDSSEGDPERLVGLTQLAENLTFFEQHGEYNSRKKKDMLYAIPAAKTCCYVGAYIIFNIYRMRAQKPFKLYINRKL